MKYSIYITICKMFYFIRFMNILATNDNESTANENPQQYTEQTLLEQVKDHNKPLIDIFPILDLIHGLCIQSNMKDYYGVDHLNAGKCKTLIYLNMESNRLVTLPEYIKFFEVMEDLNIRDNDLTQECLDIISLIFSLRVLNIAYNPIKEISKIISRLENLKELCLGGYHHIFIADEVYKLKLTTVKLYDIKLCQRTLKNKIKESELIYVMINKFLENETLENFELYCADLSEFNFDNEEYYIKRLTLRCCNISTLPDSFKKLTKLVYLDLVWNNLKLVPPILYKFKILKELNLKSNPIESYENLSFHSLETLHIKFNKGCDVNISISNTSSPLKHIHIHTDYYNRVSFDSYTIKHLKSLYQYGRSILKISKHENMFENLEFLRINVEFNTNNDICIISKFPSLRVFEFKLDMNSGPDFIKKPFLALRDLKNLEYLILKSPNLTYTVLYEDTICHLENIKKLRIVHYYIMNIKCFSAIKNLKSICFKDVRFYQSKHQVNTFMKENKIKVVYENYTFDFKHTQ